MKYNTLSNSSISNEGRKSTLTLYTDVDFLHDKVSSSNEISEISSIRNELEIVQRALNLQTRRCRQLVAEYTRRLQEKEAQYQSEKLLREDQLAKVLRALLIFEARLKQEQKYISHQLAEKDKVIKKQREHIHQLTVLENTSCKHCNYYGQKLESLGSSSEYVLTDYQDSNLSNESLDSSSETYATISNDSKNGSSPEVPELQDNNKEMNKEQKFQKNKFKDGMKRCRRVGHRKSIGDYYEVLKMRKEQISPSSENTSNDYEHIDLPLPSQAVHTQISETQNRIESIIGNGKPILTEGNLDKHEQLINGKEVDSPDEDPEKTLVNESDDTPEEDRQQQSKNNETINIFEEDQNEVNNWYASASDLDDDDIQGTSNPNPNFLECMNQILLQNMQDSSNSPPKTPTLERKSPKSPKKVKFSDEEDFGFSAVQSGEIENPINCQQLNAVNISHKMADYYETPIQKTNFYETPQSIYSNDYEQILSKSSEKSLVSPTTPEESHYYVDMDTSSLSSTNLMASVDDGLVRKSKIMRTPPALPPKPANLLSKYKIQSPTTAATPSIDSEPDYCSISELNLPAVTTGKKINVVAEINVTAIANNPDVILHSPKKSPIDSPIKEDMVVASKSSEKITIQMAKTTPTKTKPPKPDSLPLIQKYEVVKKFEGEIPKLPHVSEIIIPDEPPQAPPSPRISSDNYIKINTQIFGKSSPKSVDSRRPIVMGTSVSNLISTFNNQLNNQMIDMSPTKSPPRGKLNKKLFSSFENLQSIEKHDIVQHPLVKINPVPSFEFDLSQNFEEFKLDECDMDEYGELDGDESKDLPDITKTHHMKDSDMGEKQVETVLPKLNTESIELLKQCIEKQTQKRKDKENANYLKISAKSHDNLNGNTSEPTYEHFLECTGLSSKSILTPARMLSNHKSILKPRDIKYRSKTKQEGIKYWSEPFV